MSPKNWLPTSSEPPCVFWGLGRLPNPLWALFPVFRLQPHSLPSSGLGCWPRCCWTVVEATAEPSPVLLPPSLFVDSSRLSTEALQSLRAQCPGPLCVQVEEYGQVRARVQAYAQGDVRVWIGTEYTTYGLYGVIPQVSAGPSPPSAKGICLCHLLSSASAGQAEPAPGWEWLWLICLCEGQQG